MKKKFTDFLIEQAADSTKKPFYTLYNIDHLTNRVKKRKSSTGIDEIEYKNLLTDFLRKVGSMNK